MLIVHKSVNKIAPIYISELLKVYTPSRNLRSGNMSLLKEPTLKRTWPGDRSFSVAAPILWNHLPTKLKSCHSKTRFKSLLKTHLMSQFFKDDVYLYLHCTCISAHNVVFAIIVNCLYSCFFCFRALSTQQGGYVRATNLYYYYYYYYNCTAWVQLKMYHPWGYYFLGILTAICENCLFHRNILKIIVRF